MTLAKSTTVALRKNRKHIHCPYQLFGKISEAAICPERPAISTISTCTPEKARGDHVFKIEGYSLWKGLGVGKVIQSAPFAVGGYDWRLSYYPDGYTEGSKDLVAVFLELLSKDAEVRALYDLTLIEQATRPSPPNFTWPKPTAPVVFRNPSSVVLSCLYHSMFVRRSQIEGSAYLYIPDDILLIKCDITVIKLKEAQMRKTGMSFNIYPKESDVSFKVKDEVFTAHKIVLAMRSPVFKAELYGPMRDKCGQGQSITIEDMEPAVFKALLHFIYIDELPPMDDLHDDDEEEMVRHLLVAADRYVKGRMKLMCERKISEFLDAKTAAATLALADQHHCSKLKEACFGFINSLDRIDDVMNSVGYEHLKRTCPTIFIDIWEKAAKARKI
ncbi:BTB/POZ and MATH domain-containing protein 2 [Triticum urartu]|uniref:BTB/POZ and MATH domain-containing protein 2 n=2 Tax=Triticum urartu TaxID=4572 RepID=M7ZH36_TRIUA|nr:BTB/POZ and MATH domain-containing protein 2 [Triticum urartu]